MGLLEGITRDEGRAFLKHKLAKVMNRPPINLVRNEVNA